MKTPGPKRKFAGVLLAEEPLQVNEQSMENILTVGQLSTTPTLLDVPLEMPPSPTPSKSIDPLENSVQPTEVLTSQGTITITPTAAPIPMDTSENDLDIIDDSPQQTVVPLETDQIQLNSNAAMDIPLTGITITPPSGQSIGDNAIGLASPTTPSVPKERKRRIVIDDDDESPTFNPLRSNKKIRGKNRRSRHGLLSKKQRKAQLLSPTDKTNENSVFTSPEGIVSSFFSRLQLLTCFFLVVVVVVVINRKIAWQIILSLPL